MLGPGRAEVVVVIPIFEPPADFDDRVSAVLRQAARVIVVDDNPNGVTHWSPSGPEAYRVKVISHEENRGIAAALNTGVTEALRSPGTTHVLTLDEDSRLSGDYVELCLRRESERAAAGAPIGFLCPETMDGLTVPTLHGSRTEPFDPMQSGMFIPASTLREVGLFDEPLFIDAVDSEFTLRTRRKGLRVEFAPGTDLAHSLGRKVPARLFGRDLRIGNKTKEFSSHSPARLYYIARNHLLINCRFLSDDPRWVARRAFEDVKLIGINSVFGPRKTKSVLAVTVGIAHAVLRRTGKIPPTLAKRLSS